MRVSIIINNYNYGQYLGSAISSALSQSYSSVEVIVVDDGSTDNSQEVIGNYTKSIVPVVKPNGGQGSAFNEGFAAATGDVIIFLDSDDELYMQTVEWVVREFGKNDAVVAVQYRLDVVDVGGTQKLGAMPPQNKAMVSGQLIDEIVRTRTYQFPPTSGNAMRRSALEEILPMPENEFRAAADAYILPLLPLYGEIASIDRPGGLYRIHDANDSNRNLLASPELIRTKLRRNAATRRKQCEVLKEREGRVVPEIAVADLTHIRLRMVSLKLWPDEHPFNDSLFNLCCKGCVATLVSRRLQLSGKFVQVVWFILLSFSWKGLAVRLTDRLYNKTRTGGLLNRVSGVTPRF